MSSNAIHNLEGANEKYSLGDTGATYTHDIEGVATLKDILTELRKINMHLEYMSGLNIENYNVEGSD